MIPPELVEPPDDVVPPELDEPPEAWFPPEAWLPPLDWLQLAATAAKAKHPIHVVIVGQVIAIFRIFLAPS